MPTLPVRIDRAAATPLPAQLSAQIRALILSGTLTLDERLPSSRALAADLQVSRSVTETAYEQLIAEGWLSTRHGSGTYVASRGLESSTHRTPATTTSAISLVRLDSGTPFVDPRYRAGWRRAWREVSAATPPPGYDDPRGLLELRIALVERLARTRGLDVDPDDILITAGTTDGLRQLLAELPVGAIGVEDPGYRAAAATVRSAGRKLIDIPAAQPITQLAGMAAAYVTPAHQHPLGPVMSATDRLALLQAATAAGALIIEDDYDSEFRYDVAPIPALTSLDRDRVVYLGTASKSVYPTMRVGWMVAPPSLRDAIHERRITTHAGAAWPSQKALVTLLRDGWVDKVVRSARRLYAERALLVADAMTPHATAIGPLAGMYSAWLLAEERAVRARDAARKAGFEINLLSAYCRSSDLTGLVIGFGGISDTELSTALSALTRALESSE